MKTTIQVPDSIRAKLKLLTICKNKNYANVLEEIINKELAGYDLNGMFKDHKVKKK